MNAIDIKGKRFGRLVAQRPAVLLRGFRGWSCLCDCGAITAVRTGQLTSGKTTSCGCAKVDALIERSTRHGHARRPEYGIWANIRTRCTNQRSRAYQQYGGRGIRMHEEWQQDFAAFLRDVGPRPSEDHSIDRIDNQGNYAPGNVRWATDAEQRRNTRRNRRLTICGVSMCLADWIAEAGISRWKLTDRLDRGASEAQIIREFPQLAEIARRRSA